MIANILQLSGALLTLIMLFATRVDGGVKWKFLKLQNLVSWLARINGEPGNLSATRQEWILRFAVLFLTIGYILPTINTDLDEKFPSCIDNHIWLGVIRGVILLAGTVILVLFGAKFSVFLTNRGIGVKK